MSQKMSTNPPAITSAQNEKIKFLTALRLKKNRQAHGCFLLEGVQAIIDAANANRAIKQIFYTTHAMQVVTFADIVARQPKCFLLDDKVALKVSQRDNPLTAFAVVETWEKNIDDLSVTPNGLYLAIDRGRDPGNLGTMVRGLVAFAGGGAAVILIGDSVDFFSPEVARASMGAINHCAVYCATEPEFLAWCNKNKGGIHITATVPRGGVDCRTLPYPRPQMILLGNEQQGLSAGLQSIAHDRATINMVGAVESLNLAMAASIMMFVATQK
ncbi:MAG: RNA methyltransferase [Hydrotalea sp.]|nr:RNA methyltransferase [Hydrotalea sp.]